jgi:basic amino acid/polyamine antiporter, APA family
LTTEIAEKKPISGFRKIRKIDAVAIVIGMVIGPGIFKTPSIVAASANNEITTLGLWLAGGFISLIGAFCYAELTSTYPHAGGEYHYLGKSFGKNIAFLFAWARMTIIQTGSIAMLAFIIGDYAAEAFSFGTYSSSVYAIITVLLLTAINLRGIYPSSKLQKTLMGGIILGLLIIISIGLFAGTENPLKDAGDFNTDLIIGHAMIFILLTYGGWNEAAYLSSEVGTKRMEIAKVLFYSIGIITFIYLVMNFALLRGLGFEGVTASKAVAADLISKFMGEDGVKLISIIIAVAAFSTVNAVMITGARTNYALGADFRQFKFLSKWNEHAPANAFLFQAGIALILIMLGSFTRSGFITMVEFTAPVFWFFFLLVGISLFILRWKDPNIKRPFTVPLYPFIPLLFCATAVFMLHSSLVYTGIGALIGVLVLLTGIPFIYFNKRRILKTEEVK